MIQWALKVNGVLRSTSVHRTRREVQIHAGRYMLGVTTFQSIAAPYDDLTPEMMNWTSIRESGIAAKVWKAVLHDSPDAKIVRVKVVEL